jgi:hypothetical protein
LDDDPNADQINLIKMEFVRAGIRKLGKLAVVIVTESTQVESLDVVTSCLMKWLGNP